MTRSIQTTYLAGQLSKWNREIRGNWVLLDRLDVPFFRSTNCRLAATWLSKCNVFVRRDIRFFSLPSLLSIKNWSILFNISFIQSGRDLFHMAPKKQSHKKLSMFVNSWIRIFWGRNSFVSRQSSDPKVIHQSVDWCMCCTYSSCLIVLFLTSKLPLSWKVCGAIRTKTDSKACCQDSGNWRRSWGVYYAFCHYCII